MTITVVPRNPAGLLGPGALVDITSDFVGPLPTGSFWVVDFVVGAGAVLPFWHIRPATVQPRLSTRVLTPTETENAAIEGGAQPSDDVPVRVQVTLADPVHIVDTGEVAIPWSNTQGLGEQQLLLQGKGAGLTVEEHGWLDNVQQFIQNTAAFGGRLGLQTLAGGILEHPDVGLMHECDSPFDLVSGVDLTRPATGIGVNAFGLVLRVIAAPAGAGLRHGAVNEFQTRVAQLVSVHRSASSSTEYVTEILDLRGEQFAWLWQNAYPERISVDVTPGFTVQASWLCVTLPV